MSREGSLAELEFGGAEGDRTPDLMNAIHALSQLSYGPVIDFGRGRPFVSACNHRGELALIQSAANPYPVCRSIAIDARSATSAN